MLLILVGLGTVVCWKQGRTVLTTDQPNEPPDEDTVAIRMFIAKPNLEILFVNTDLPMSYFRVGKVTKVAGGENMEAVEGWIRQVNVYEQTELIKGQCAVYEYHTDARNHTLTAVIIRGLRPSEIDSLKNNGITCISNPGNVPNLTKAEAETIAMNYLKRAVPNFNQIKDQLVYTQQQNGESHDWVWEDKGYKLPEGLSSRPYLYPTIRISVYGNNEIQYWNTVSLFEN